MLNKNKMLFAVLAVNNGTYPISRMLVSAAGACALCCCRKDRMSVSELKMVNFCLLRLTIHDNLRFNLNWLNLLYYGLECR